MATADWLIYSPEHKVIICKIHGFAISALSSHLSRQHADLSCRVRNTIIAEYNTLELDRPSDANFRYGPANPTAAIDGLTIHKGLACQDFQQCRFMSTSRKMLKVHCKKEHQWQVSRADPTHWSEVKLQTFFTVPGSAIHYFCVTTGPQANAGDEDGEEVDPDIDTEEAHSGGGGSRQRQNSKLITEIKEQWEYEQSRQEELQRVLAEGILRHETTTWLRRSGWTAHFNGRDLHRIHLCSRMPGPEDDVLQRLTANLDHLFFQRCVDGLKSMPLMTRLLLASPHPHDAHSRPFGPLQERTSMERNLTYWKRFLCYCLNVLSLDEAALLDQHGFRFTEAQRASLEQLWDHVRSDHWPDRLLQEELLQVSASFWMQQLSGDP